MDITTASNDLPSILSSFSEVFINSNILFIFSFIFLIFVLYIFYTLKGKQMDSQLVRCPKIERSDQALLYSILEDLSKKAGIVTPEF